MIDEKWTAVGKWVGDTQPARLGSSSRNLLLWDGQMGGRVFKSLCPSCAPLNVLKAKCYMC